MSEHDAPPSASPPPSLLHRCIVCKQLASFGYTTGHGTIWTCLLHREAGERRLVTPPLVTKRA